MQHILLLFTVSFLFSVVGLSSAGERELNEEEQREALELWRKHCFGGNGDSSVSNEYGPPQGYDTYGGYGPPVANNAQIHCKFGKDYEDSVDKVVVKPTYAPMKPLKQIIFITPPVNNVRHEITLDGPPTPPRRTLIYVFPSKSNHEIQVQDNRMNSETLKPTVYFLKNNQLQQQTEGGYEEPNYEPATTSPPSGGYGGRASSYQTSAKLRIPIQQEPEAEVIRGSAFSSAGSSVSNRPSQKLVQKTAVTTTSRSPSQKLVQKPTERQHPRVGTAVTASSRSPVQKLVQKPTERQRPRVGTAVTTISNSPVQKLVQKPITASSPESSFQRLVQKPVEPESPRVVFPSVPGHFQREALFRARPSLIKFPGQSAAVGPFRKPADTDITYFQQRYDEIPFESLQQPVYTVSPNRPLFDIIPARFSGYYYSGPNDNNENIPTQL